MTTASLVVVGCGIKFAAHLTCEARAYIEQSDCVLYLVNDPAMKTWLQALNPRAVSLDDLYTSQPQRHACYEAITQHILSEVRKQQHVCVVLYGHPTVYSKPGLDAVRLALGEGFDARILPAISAEACLFADLLIDPGRHGCQSYEATDFLIHARAFDPASYLLLWQVDSIGVLDHGSQASMPSGLPLLMERLLTRYTPSQAVILYEAAQYPGFHPRIERLSLHQLPQARLTRLTTLCLPPASPAPLQTSVLSSLQLRA